MSLFDKNTFNSICCIDSNYVNASYTMLDLLDRLYKYNVTGNNNKTNNITDVFSGSYVIMPGLMVDGDLISKIRSKDSEYQNKNNRDYENKIF